MKTGRKTTGLLSLLGDGRVANLTTNILKGLCMKELTTKASILQHIFDATKAHKEWVRKAERLVHGLNGYQGKRIEIKVDETFIPLDSSSCEFGKWFDSHSLHLSTIPSVGRFVHRIEEHHNQLHETYANIYEIFFVRPKNRSVLHKLLTMNSKKVSAAEKEQAKIYFKYLKHSSNELLEVLSVLEEKIKNLDHNELKRAVRAAVDNPS